MSQHSTAYEDEGLYYSYAACGFSDAYSSSQVGNLLKNKVLRVLFFHNVAGWNGAFHPRGINNERSGDYYGTYVDLVNAMAANGQFTINITMAPEHVRARAENISSSRWTQCAFYAGLGFVDICIGSYTVTLQRVQLTRMVFTATEDVYALAALDDVRYWMLTKCPRWPLRGLVGLV